MTGHVTLPCEFFIFDNACLYLYLFLTMLGALFIFDNAWGMFSWCSVECKAGMLVVVVQFLFRSKNLLVEVVKNLSLYSKELRVRARCAQVGYSNPDRIMA